MTPSEIAAAVRHVKPRFLEGLAAPEVKAILSAAKPRHCVANSVVTNQGHPAEHLFLLLNGRARYFFVTPDGEKMFFFGFRRARFLAGLHRVLLGHGIKRISPLKSAPEGTRLVGGASIRSVLAVCKQ